MARREGLWMARWNVCVSLVAATACSSGEALAPGSVAPQDASGVDASVDDAPAVTGDAAVRPETTACVGDIAWCLFGTATVTGFSANAYGPEVNLYRVFPSGLQVPVASQLVAHDGTWAFSGLDTIGVGDPGAQGGAVWSHYYVALGVGFGRAADGQAPPRASVIAGPLGVPSSGDSGASIDLAVKPVSVQVAESFAGGGTMLDWASARVLDPATGREIVGGDGGVSVALAIGDASVPMPWTSGTPSPSYYVAFAGSQPAQLDYTVTTTWAPLFDAGPTTSILSAAPPDFTGMVTSPSADASVVANGSLDVAWTAEPRADYEIVEVFKRLAADGGPASWGLTYASPVPESPDSTRDHIGGDGDAAPDAGSPIPGAGTYLLNVFYTKANCPPSKDGCVYASSVADTIFSAY